MAEEYRQGLSTRIVYSAAELDEGLDKHPQLSKDLGPDTHLEFRKVSEPGRMGERYRAGIWTQGRREEVVWASSASQLLERVRAKLDKLEKAVGEEE